MKRWLPVLTVLAGFGSSFSPSMFAQLDSSYKCEDERVLPNLHMAQRINVSGVVLDESGATFSRITLQIENPHDSKVLLSAAVDDKGHFDFGSVPPGEFRLVPVKIANNKAARISGFDPPHSLVCSGNQACELRITLPVRPTDLPYEFCPPR
jgi:hypothetical protein